MKRTLLLFILGSCVVHAQTYYMNVRLRGGGTTSIAVQDIQKLTFSGVTTVGDGKLADVIRTFTLLQNYPNPFNPSTTIEFQVPRSGNAEIRIFNLAGQLVKTLVTTFAGSGTHKVVWDGKNNSGHTVATGAYVYQVSFENFVLAKKMLFIK